jgi:membrane protein
VPEGRVRERLRASDFGRIPVARTGAVNVWVGIGNENPLPPMWTPDGFASDDVVMSIAGLFRDAWNRWLEDGAFEMSAALAYYAIFAMAPALIILTFLVGLVYQGDPLERVHAEMAELVGPETADLVTTAVVQTNSRLAGSFVYTVVAVLLLLLGVSALSDQLRVALNNVLRVARNPNQSFWYMIKKRFSTLVIVFAFGVVLQMTILISWGISLYRQSVLAVLPSVEFVWHTINLGISFAVVATLTAVIYKWLPDTDMTWHDVWIASLVTAVLLSAGRYAIALYLAYSGFESIYGVASSIMILLAWVYYSSFILLYGAEFMHVVAAKRNVDSRKDNQEARA